MFPYPSGAGLHVGHPKGYIGDGRRRALQAHARASTCCTRWAGTRSGCRPSSTRSRRARTRASPPRATSTPSGASSRRLGLSYDWAREIDTTRPRLLPLDAVDLREALRARPRLRGRGAGELVPGARHRARERRGDRRQERERRPSRACGVPMKQWMLRITAYAERLLADLDGLDWPESIKKMQREWIGRSRGRATCASRSRIAPAREIEVFTTRPDTLFGATYMVLAPEHPLVAEITTPAQRARRRRLRRAGRAARASARASPSADDKTGVVTGAFAREPGERRAHPDLDRRLRARELRHRRDHGRARARRARLRVRDGSSACRSARSCGAAT